MKYNVMLTSLPGGRVNRDIEYYYSEESVRPMYCDAIMAAEASSKYILANYHIDEIVTLGRKTSYDPGDEVKEMVLREGSSFYSSDIGSLSTYSLLRYRLAQYIDEIRIEDQDIINLLSGEEREKVEDFCKQFYKEHIQKKGNAKYNRYFDILRSDADLRMLFMNELIRTIPETEKDPDRYRTWILAYLYNELKDTSKLELLAGNEDVKIKFIPTDEEGSLSFADKLLGGFQSMRRESEEHIEFDIYVCILGEDANDTFALMNLIDVVKAVPGSYVNVVKIATASYQEDDFASSITDDTELYGISDLLAGTRAFLRYGKTDLLMDYWIRQKNGNPYIERLLYAMRNIDIGISLCDITDIERGMESLRYLFAQGDFVPGDDIVERYFDIVVDAIKEDYGVLVTGNDSGFIDMVKWAYHKGFWQQTLTLIESRAPDDFVNRGIFYYMDDESLREKIVSILGQIYYDLKPFEKYKLDDISHYFVKFYGRNRADRPGRADSNVIQKLYTDVRIEDLEADDDDIICAFTNCTDVEALTGLLYSYYIIGDVRNRINHAEEENQDIFSNRNDADLSERMNLINDATQRFIMMYDRVTASMDEDPSPVLFVDTSEIRAYARTLRPYGKNQGDRKIERPDGDK